MPVVLLTQIVSAGLQETTLNQWSLKQRSVTRIIERRQGLSGKRHEFFSLHSWVMCCCKNMIFRHARISYVKSCWWQLLLQYYVLTNMSKSIFSFSPLNCRHFLCGFAGKGSPWNTQGSTPKEFAGHWETYRTPLSGRTIGLPCWSPSWGCQIIWGSRFKVTVQKRYFLLLVMLTL
jgi:hypothetical protein